MVLYIVGLGLGNEKDITVKGLEAVKKCSRVYLEHYTAILGVGHERLVCAVLANVESGTGHRRGWSSGAEGPCSLAGAMAPTE